MRKLCCGILLLVLCLGLAALPAAADDIIFFTAVNNTLLELTRETMPVKYSSMIYVPSSVFNSTALGTFAYYSRNNQTVLISDGNLSLYFDMSEGNSYDDEQDYRYAAVYVNDTAYVPAYFVAEYFDLGYSYIRKDGMHIVRLTSGNVLDDEDFFNAAESQLENRLNDYLRQQGKLPVTTPPAASSVPTATPRPTPTTTPEIDRSSVTACIAIIGLGENSAAQLDGLLQQELPVCFFATAEEVYENADLVRRILGEGGSIGVRMETDPAAEAEAFRTALRDTAMSVSFLACLDYDSSALREAAEATGLNIWYSGVTITTIL